MCKTFYSKTAKELLTIQWVSENNSTKLFNLESKSHFCNSIIPCNSIRLKTYPIFSNFFEISNFSILMAFRSSLSKGFCKKGVPNTRFVELGTAVSIGTSSYNKEI